MKYLYRSLSLVLAAVLIFVSLDLDALAATDYEACDNLLLSVDGKQAVTVKALYYNYDNAAYISLRDLANALIGTPKAFELSVDGSTARLTTGMDYQPLGIENKGFEEALIKKGYENKTYLRHNLMYKDGLEIYYYTFILKTDGYNDCFMNIQDVAMNLDLNMSWDDRGISVNTSSGYELDMDSLLDQGYFRLVNSALVGNADTGEIYFEKDGDRQVAMASTTKLMTSLVLMDAIASGEISWDDDVIISDNAARISHTGDGVIWFEAESIFSLDDLMHAMMLASSNESALALAEHLCGNEADFVARMNRKAAEIGLSEQTVFYNTNGLPTYEKSISQQKRQNYITAEDMFKLSSYILKTYPEITEITSKKTAKLSTIGTDVATTNILLYNTEGVNGLKTGTTNRAGCCLVTSALNNSGDTIIAIEFGAESATLRGQISAILIKYGLDYTGTGTAPEPAQIPTKCSDLVRMIVRLH